MKVRPVGLAVGVLLCAAASGVVAHRTFDSCVIGYIGSRATVTIRGWDASRSCQQLIAANKDRYYARTEPATEPVLCEVPIGPRRFIVRDDGALVILGRIACEALRDSSARVTSVRTGS